MSNLKERLDLLREEIQKDDFLDGKGLSNEVNIRIFCYDPAEEMTVTHFLEQIKTDQSLNCRLIECNLYKTFLSICDDLDITDALLVVHHSYDSFLNSDLYASKVLPTKTLGFFLHLFDNSLWSCNSYILT